ncbi:MAG: helix-turn-helix domain-containing protein, partial [Desulfobacterales bacterium]|nr:helix-turn-helix domain-containing protein [Desulfobacterales bacterium]
MEKQELIAIRKHLGKTQKEMARLLGVSLKGVKSFEQGWRKIPIHVERQVLFLLSLKEPPDKTSKACWQVKRCSMELREKCPAW